MNKGRENIIWKLNVRIIQDHGVCPGIARFSPISYIQRSPNLTPHFHGAGREAEEDE